MPGWGRVCRSRESQVIVESNLRSVSRPMGVRINAKAASRVKIGPTPVERESLRRFGGVMRSVVSSSKL